MQVRQITENDKIEIASWFELRAWPLPPVEGIMAEWGLVAESDGKLLACLWVYEIVEGVWEKFSWTATNPDVDEKIGMSALMLLISKLQESAASVGPSGRTLTHFTTSERFANRLKKAGFKLKRGYEATWQVKGRR